MSKDSPGPGFYENNISNLRGSFNPYESTSSPKCKSSTIPKSKRQLSDVKVDYYIGPNSYQNTNGFKGEIGSGKNKIAIGREERDYDPIKYAQQNKILVIKGLN